VETRGDQRRYYSTGFSLNRAGPDKWLWISGTLRNWFVCATTTQHETASTSRDLLRRVKCAASTSLSAVAASFTHSRYPHPHYRMLASTVPTMSFLVYFGAASRINIYSSGFHLRLFKCLLDAPPSLGTVGRSRHAFVWVLPRGRFHVSFPFSYFLSRVGGGERHANHTVLAGVGIDVV
jgi:hypothetical protein